MMIAFGVTSRTPHRRPGPHWKPSDYGYDGFGGADLIGALIVTHGNLAHELLNAARQIEADVTAMEAVPLEWNDTVDESREKIASALNRVGHDRSVIIFTDMFGGTPSNISLSFLEQGRIEVVTGVNLPMVVKFAMLKEESSDVSALAHVITEKGSKSIRVASDLLVTSKGNGAPA
jgi:mannose PTS system EIIA component